MSQESDDEFYLSQEAQAALRSATSQSSQEDSDTIKALKEMVANGHSMEAAIYAKLLAYSGAMDSRAALIVLAEAILNPVKRRRGDKFNSRMTLEKLVREDANARAVESAVAASKERSRGGRKKHVAKALAKIGKDSKRATSVGSVKRAYYKHKSPGPTK